VAEGLFDCRRGRFDLLSIRHVGGNDERLTAQRLDLLSGRLQTFGSASHQSNASAALAERSRHGSAHAGRSPRDNDNLASFHDRGLLGYRGTK
jgi:hypothetical protein